MSYNIYLKETPEGTEKSVFLVLPNKDRIVFD